MTRYDSTPITTRWDGKRVYLTTLYPYIPPQSTDLQIITNEVGSIKQGFRAAKEVTDILRQSTEAEKAKNFARSTLEHIRGRLDKATQPNMVAAARAFA